MARMTQIPSISSRRKSVSSVLSVNSKLGKMNQNSAEATVESEKIPAELQGDIKGTIKIDKVSNGCITQNLLPCCHRICHRIEFGV